MTIQKFKINKEKMTEIRSFHNPPPIVYPAMNLLAILIRGEEFMQWKKLKPFICNLHLLQEAKEAKLTPHKVALINKSKNDWNLVGFSLAPVCKTLGEINVLKFIDARVEEYELMNNELKMYSEMESKLKKGKMMREAGLKGLDEQWK